MPNLPWLPVIQPYEDYGMQKYVDFTPNPNQQFEVRRFNFKLRRALGVARPRQPSPLRCRAAAAERQVGPAEMRRRSRYSRTCASCCSPKQRTDLLSTNPGQDRRSGTQDDDVSSCKTEQQG